MKRVSVIDATKVSLAPVETSANQFTNVDIFHLMDEGMSYLAKRYGHITGANGIAVAQGKGDERGRDNTLVHAFLPYVDLLRSLINVPLVAADVGVFEKAVLEYDRIAAIVSFAPMLDSGAAVVKRYRETTNLAFDVNIRFADAAFVAAAGGDDAHNRIIYASAPWTEAVVL